MLIRNAVMTSSAIQLLPKMDALGGVIAQTTSWEDLLADVRAVVRAVAKKYLDGFPPGSVVTEEGNFLSLTCDHAPTLNSQCMTPFTDAVSVPATMEYRRMGYGSNSTTGVNRIESGLLQITPLCSYATALIHDYIFKNTNNPAVKTTYQTRLVAWRSHLNAVITEFETMEAKLLMIPEDFIYVAGGAVYMHRPVSVDLVSDVVSVVSYASLPPEAQSSFESARDAALLTMTNHPALADATLPLLKDHLGTLGAGAWLEDQSSWLSLNNVEDVRYVIDAPLREFIDTHASRFYALVGLYGRFFFSSMTFDPTTDAVLQIARDLRKTLLKVGVRTDINSDLQYGSLEEYIEEYFADDPAVTATDLPFIVSYIRLKQGKVGVTFGPVPDGLSLADQLEARSVCRTLPPYPGDWPADFVSKVSVVDGHLAYAIGGLQWPFDLVGSKYHTDNLIGLWSNSALLTKCRDFLAHITLMEELFYALFFVEDIESLTVDDEIVLRADHSKIIENVALYVASASKIFVIP